ncbi:MAG: endonuclease MutS2 [Oscillospiraceae bacterium]|nr:endonuclease MutS2 [Oscillospiraceae bacterium]
MQPFEQVLELDKVLARAAEFTSNESSRRMMLDTKPSCDLAEVRAEVGKTDDALRLAMQFGTPPFTGFKDICGMVTRAASGARLSLRDLLDVADLLRQVQSLHSWYAHCSGEATSLDYLFSLITPLDGLLTTLERSIVSEEELADAASPTLSEIRRKLVRQRSHLRDTLDQMTRNKTMQKYLQETTVTIRDGRFVLPVKAEYRSQVAGLIHDTSSSGATLFIEPMQIVEANNDIRLLESREVEEIDRIMQKLCAEVGAESSQLRRLHATCAELDYYFAKANYAASLKAVKPSISDNGVIELKKARHPLLDQQKAVPIDLTLGGEHNALIVTGPNTGGKTVALKTAGLLTAMTMCGLLIPTTDGSRISIFRHILADIGDSQSIEQSLSTFSSHTTNLVEILSIADDSTLVLLDELGGGTDPVEGAALAIAVIDHLKDLGAKLMVTTHYQELKLYAADTPDVINASCEFNTETLKPTYRLILGSPGKSNAFAISGQLGVPKSILDHAQSLISEENRRFENVISRFEEARKQLEAEREEAEQLRREAEQFRAEWQEKRDNAAKEEKELLERASEQASRIVESTKAQSNALLDELESLRKAKDKADFSARVSAVKGQSSQQLRDMYKTANPVIGSIGENGEYVLPRPLKKGDKVLIADLQQEAVISGEPDGSDNVFVQMGIMKMKIQVSRLRLLDKSKQNPNALQKKKQPRRGQVSAKVERKGSMELDIRGMACDEGVMEVERFIDGAVLSNVGTVTIIHGKGTGVLRKAVQQRLSRMKCVKSYRNGLYGEGEEGVTVVTLR